LGDIDPTTVSSRYSPRESTLVDAVAEAKRIADQQMRSNPLTNAQINSGLTLWKGNYGGSLVWIGEISPEDKNQFDQYGKNKKQRGFVLQRDDPSQSFAMTMYDFGPTAGVPLKQRLSIFDVNGRRTYTDGVNGGRSFPDQPIVMYQRESIDPTGATFFSDRVMYSGEGNMVGTSLDFSGAWGNTVGTDTISNFVRVSGGGVTVNSPTQNVTASGGNTSITLDISAIYNANTTDYINVEWHIWRSAGSGAYTPRIYKCRNYSPFQS